MSSAVNYQAGNRRIVGHLIHDALSLQGVLGYNWGEVLKTLKQAEYITPVSSAFFSSKVYFSPSVRLIKDLIRQEICRPSCFGFERLGALSKRVSIQNTNKEAIHG